ncbi:hypothetical protein C1I98_01530 [Spongiactinospora gelatinilytica]|uniref:DUF6879 domain-containing protein n=1 Tax=Spongiactinospora gelatinilytica TaxID=2666298 RepID=A0A2W2HMG9_9ACTN|nr:DUF6879 family protein [Spongiactinospora gelatinilytica]PZG56339.1 hypothetical protein C1I98_01530 [Spongiactinospora gelatinilytica]
MTLVSGEAFGDLFRSFERTAFRLEPRERYNSPGEQEPLRRFLAGEPDDLGWNRPWLDLMAEHAAKRKFVHRVRVVSVPLSEYSRFGLWCAQFALQAGEDIRYLDRARAQGLPQDDYWLFDSKWAAVLRFDDDDVLLGAEIVTDPATVAELAAGRDDAWHRAVTRDQFLASLAGSRAPE